jgi:hypothetical protein
MYRNDARLRAVLSHCMVSKRAVFDNLQRGDIGCLSASGSLTASVLIAAISHSDTARAICAELLLQVLHHFAAAAILADSFSWDMNSQLQVPVC